MGIRRMRCMSFQQKFSPYGSYLIRILCVTFLLALTRATFASAARTVAVTSPRRRNYSPVLLEMDGAVAGKMAAFPERVNGQHRPNITLKPLVEPSDTQPRSTAYPWIEVATQSYFRNEILCSPGTYPLKTPGAHINRTESLVDYDFDHSGEQQGSSLERKFVHEHVVAFVEGRFKGTQVRMNVWKPYVNKWSEFSLAQVWLVATDNFTTNSIEAGWQVYEGKYGDKRPRLFTYWTADNYNKTGCYNLDCPGFVQVSNKVILGGAFETASTQNSIQYEMRLQIFQDLNTSNWWLRMNNEYVGYWPSALFTNSLGGAGSNVIQWGGEVLGRDAQLESHTNTRMGSGAFPQSGFQKAAYFRQMKFVNLNNELQDAIKMTMGAEAPSCYNSDAPLFGEEGDLDTCQFCMPFPTWGAHFFFGGSGRSDTC